MDAYRSDNLGEDSDMDEGYQDSPQQDVDPYKKQDMQLYPPGMNN